VKADRGYILLDILMGLFIFGLGFTVILGLMQTAALGGAQAHNLLEAVNVATSALEETTGSIMANPDAAYAFLDQGVKGQTGLFRKTVTAHWEQNDLLRITVEINWAELGQSRNYRLESLVSVPG
jgi:hypothetical protein